MHKLCQYCTQGCCHSSCRPAWYTRNMTEKLPLLSVRFLGLSSHFGCHHCPNYHTKCRYCGQNEGSSKSLRLVVLEIWNLCTVAQYWVTPPALRGQKNFCPTMAIRHCSFRHSIGSNESKNAQNRTVYIFTSLFENLLFGCLTITEYSSCL